jgi:hypothetical protein
MSKNPWLAEIPSVEGIIDEGVARLNSSIDFEKKVKNGEISPSRAAIMLERECHKIYLEYEKRVREKYRGSVDQGALERSLGQSRMARGGLATESIIYRLIDLLGIPCEKKVPYPGRDGETLDIVIPDKARLKRNPSNAVIISVKRNVRERWREIVGEATILREVHNIPDNIWFATITCDISEYIVKSMIGLRIRVYIPDECYEEFKQFGAAPLSQMFDDLVSFLKEKGVVV